MFAGKGQAQVPRTDAGVLACGPRGASRRGSRSALLPGGVALIEAPVVPRRAEAVTFGGKGRTEASAMEPGKLF